MPLIDLIKRVVAAGGLPREDTVAFTPGGSGDTTYGDAKFKKFAAANTVPPGQARLGGPSGGGNGGGGGGGGGAAGVGWGVDNAPDAQQLQPLDPEMTPHNIRSGWTFEEDHHLLAHIAADGPKAWASLAEKLMATLSGLGGGGGTMARTGKECRERYNTVIKGKVILLGRREQAKAAKAKRKLEEGGSEEGSLKAALKAALDGEGVSSEEEQDFEPDANHFFECRTCRKSMSAVAFTRKQRRRPTAERVCMECTGDLGGNPGLPGGGDDAFASNETMRKATYDELVGLFEMRREMISAAVIGTFWKEFGSRRLVLRVGGQPTEREGGWHATLHSLCSKTQLLLPEADPRDVSLVMVGLVRAQLEKISSSLGRQVIMLLDLGAQHVMNRLEELTPSLLAGVAKSIATLCDMDDVAAHQTEPPPERRAAFTRLGNVAIAKLDAEQPDDQFRFNAADMIDILCAFTTAKLSAPKLFARCAALLPERIAEHDRKADKMGAESKFTPTHLSRACWAFATAHVPAPALFALLARRALVYLNLFEPKSLAILAWCYAVADERNHGDFLARCSDFIAHSFNNRGGPTGFKEEHLRQLHQFQCWVQLEAQEPRALLPDAMRAECARIMVTESDGNAVQGSKLQNDVANAVRRLDMPDAVHEEYTIPGLGSIVDIAIPKAKLVIEVDGPSHYTHHAVGPRQGGPPVESNGPTRMKERHVRAFGWRMFSVPYFEWQPLNSPEAKQAYLQAKLRDALEPGEYAAHASKRLKTSGELTELAPSLLTTGGELVGGVAGPAPTPDPFTYTPPADPFSGWLKKEAAPADPRMQASAADPRLQASAADPRLQGAIADPRRQAAAADPRTQTAAQASCAAALGMLGAGFAGSCAGAQAGGGGQWGPYGCSTGGAGFAHGAMAAAANDAGGAPEAPPPNPYKKVVTDEDLDGLDL